MTIPAVQYTTVAPAELTDTVSLRDGLWCVPCQSSGCSYTLQVERALAAERLGTGSQGGFTSLSAIERPIRYGAQGELLVECWFDNEARLCWSETSEGAVTQVTFTPEQSTEPRETTHLPDTDSAYAALAIG